MLHAALVVVACGFAIVTGANDGGAMLAAGLRTTTVAPGRALLVLAGCLVIAPLIVGTNVAATFTRRLVEFHGSAGHVAVLIGILAAIFVVASLTARGLPTSLTMAVIGGLAGAGQGMALSVKWHTVILVMLVGMAAPIGVGLIGFGLARFTSRLPPSAGLMAAVRVLHPVAFLAQSFAYASNDAQKMLSIFAIATGASGLTQGVRTMPDVGWLALLAMLFSFGALIALRRMASSIGGQLTSLRSLHMTSAQFGATAAALTSASAGLPVSMTQSLAAGLVGVGVSEGARRVRWRAALRIALAWIVTVPGSVILALVVALASRSLGG